ncbi:MAG: K(+)-transporting ATPase subunit C [Acidimicrobiales bacterium]|nr:K(+)-transporting ATPase subunit C [Acidimicrobiales bacterium]
MRRQLLPALRLLAVFTVLVGIAYPLFVTGVAQVAFPDQAAGSIVTVDGEAVGSSLLGQEFTGDEYFESRPSAAGDGYDAASSGPSNLGPSNPDLLAAVEERAVTYRERNGLDADAAVPVDAVTASASGLDPHISVANARLQAERVAAARGLPVEDVLALVDDHTEGRALGFLGEVGVNVLELNLALDRAAAS